MYHGTLYTNKQIRKLLRKAGIDQKEFTLEVVKGKPSKTKNKIRIKNGKVTIFGSDFIAKGYVHQKKTR